MLNIKTITIKQTRSARKYRVGVTTYPLLNSQDKKKLVHDVLTSYRKNIADGWGRNVSIKKAADEHLISLQVAQIIIIKEQQIAPPPRIMRWVK